MNQFDFIITGNSIAVLVSAIELAKKGKVLIINPAKSWGAHFGGMKIGGSRFDFGMNLLEFGSFYEPSGDLATYNPEIRNDSARFFGKIQELITSRIKCREVEPLKTLVNGVCGNDLIISNYLDLLWTLPDEAKSAIKSEIKAILAAPRDPLHASNKRTGEQLFLNTSYQAVSLANHGPTFHKLFIEPFCSKIMGMPSDGMSAMLHRVAWVPLYYPETLLAAIESEKQVLEPCSFSYPENSYFGSIAEELLAEVQNNKNAAFDYSKITAIDEQPRGYRLITEGQACSTENLIWAADLQGLLAHRKVEIAADYYDKSTIRLAFAAIKTGDVINPFSCLYAADGEDYIYRITNQTACSGSSSEYSNLVIELSDSNNGSEMAAAETENYIINFLSGYGFIKSGSKFEIFDLKIIKNGIIKPTAENYNRSKKLFEQARENFNSIEYIGAGLGAFANSFNCQVVQGLKLGVKY